MLVQLHSHRFTQAAGALILLAALLPGLTDQAEARQTRPQHELCTLLQ
ncbi:hypothetical protein [uncultured Thiocystis sp.]|jgi:hypothetical protein|nr:hypothetical protein [uncultured Thiocystis sp.]